MRVNLDTILRNVGTDLCLSHLLNARCICSFILCFSFLLLLQYLLQPSNALSQTQMNVDAMRSTSSSMPLPPSNADSRRPTADVRTIDTEWCVPFFAAYEHLKNALKRTYTHTCMRALHSYRHTHTLSNSRKSNFSIFCFTFAVGQCCYRRAR